MMDNLISAIKFLIFFMVCMYEFVLYNLLIYMWGDNMYLCIGIALSMVGMLICPLMMVAEMAQNKRKTNELIEFLSSGVLE